LQYLSTQVASSNNLTHQGNKAMSREQIIAVVAGAVLLAGAAFLIVQNNSKKAVETPETIIESNVR
jgi:hypothetical protein